MKSNTRSCLTSRTTARIARLIKIFSHELSLDAGCGDGVYLSFFNGNVIGMDIDLTALKKAKNLERKPSLILGDVGFLPFRDKVFRFVSSSSVLDHLYEKDCDHVMSELQRVTNEKLVVDVSNYNSFFRFLAKLIFFRRLHYHDPSLHHSRWMTKRLKIYGFEVKGCLGWVTRVHILKSNFLFNVLDSLLWYFPSISGTIVGIMDMS